MTPVDVLVDTTVWSLSLRRRVTDLSQAERRNQRELIELITEGRVVIIGGIRQEVLSGIAVASRFADVRDYLRDFDDEPVSALDYERAAECYNICRAGGIQGSTVDFLICAVSERLDVPIFTVDGDFPNYARHLPISLHTARDW